MDFKIKDFGNECFAFRIRKLSRMITALYDGALRETDLTVSQLGMLAAIGYFGQISPGKLSQEVLLMDKSTMSRNLAVLKRNGWVKASRSQEDERIQVLSLTKSGLSALKSAYPAWQKAQAQVETTLGEAGVESLHSVMAQLQAKGQDE